MKAIIPVAGAGTRLRPHTFTTPKPLVFVAGKPILGHIIDKILKLNVNEIVFVIGHMGDKIQEYVLENYPKIKSHFIVQKEQKGLGHAIYLCKEIIANDSCLIIYGDTIFMGDISAGLQDNIDGAIAVKEVIDPRRFGVILTNGKRITKLVEKPTEPISNLAIVGVNFIYNSSLMFNCLNEIIKNNIKTKNEYQITDAFEMMIQKGANLTHFNVEGWLDCGNLDSLLQTNKYLLDIGYQKELIVKNSVIIHPVYIEDSTIIENSIIGPYVSIAKESHIYNSVIENSIVNNNSIIYDAHLSDSVIGENAKVKGKKHKLNVGNNSEIEFS